MPLIGLTGGYASGKSLVLSVFRELGAYIIDCDQLARDVVEKGAEGLTKVKEAFGDGVLTADGSLDREKMAAQVFSDEAKRKKLERILHPLIIGRVYQTAEDILRGGEDRMVIVDAPLLYEAGMEKKMAKVVVVVCPQEEQIRRGMARDRLGQDEAMARIKAQAPLSQKAQQADYIIDNSGDMQATMAAASALWQELRKL
ncbi:MAG: dephospho-CoA kinase [Nitrospinota bacterium]|nr:dephospho-CoA kinase [Nitrospinota bacterium]